MSVDDGKVTLWFDCIRYALSHLGGLENTMKRIGDENGIYFFWNKIGQLPRVRLQPIAVWGLRNGQGFFCRSLHLLINGEGVDTPIEQG